MGSTVSRSCWVWLGKIGPAQGNLDRQLPSTELLIGTFRLLLYLAIPLQAHAHEKQEKNPWGAAEPKGANSPVSGPEGTDTQNSRPTTRRTVGPRERVPHSHEQEQGL